MLPGQCKESSKSRTSGVGPSTYFVMVSRRFSCLARKREEPRFQRGQLRASITSSGQSHELVLHGSSRLPDLDLRVLIDGQVLLGSPAGPLLGPIAANVVPRSGCWRWLRRGRGSVRSERLSRPTQPRPLRRGQVCPGSERTQIGLSSSVVFPILIVVVDASFVGPYCHEANRIRPTIIRKISMTLPQITLGSLMPLVVSGQVGRPNATARTPAAASLGTRAENERTADRC